METSPTKLSRKNARFSTVVQRCGRPEAVPLPRNPGKHLQIHSLLRQNRAATISLNGRAEGAFALVGLLEKRRSVVLAFPKSLKRFQDKRIIEIDWDLIKD